MKVSAQSIARCCWQLLVWIVWIVDRTAVSDTTESLLSTMPNTSKLKDRLAVFEKNKTTPLDNDHLNNSSGSLRGTSSSSKKAGHNLRHSMSAAPPIRTRAFSDADDDCSIRLDDIMGGAEDLDEQAMAQAASSIAGVPYKSASVRFDISMARSSVQKAKEVFSKSTSDMNVDLRSSTYLTNFARKDPLQKLKEQQHQQQHLRNSTASITAVKGSGGSINTVSTTTASSSSPSVPTPLIKKKETAAELKKRMTAYEQNLSETAAKGRGFHRKISFDRDAEKLQDRKQHFESPVKQRQQQGSGSQHHHPLSMAPLGDATSNERLNSSISDRIALFSKTFDEEKAEKKAKKDAKKAKKKKKAEKKKKKKDAVDKREKQKEKKADHHAERRRVQRRLSGGGGAAAPELDRNATPEANVQKRVAENKAFVDSMFDAYISGDDGVLKNCSPGTRAKKKLEIQVKKQAVVDIVAKETEKAAKVEVREMLFDSYAKELQKAELDRIDAEMQAKLKAKRATSRAAFAAKKKKEQDKLEAEENDEEVKDGNEKEVVYVVKKPEPVTVAAAQLPATKIKRRRSITGADDTNAELPEEYRDPDYAHAPQAPKQGLARKETICRKAQTDDEFEDIVLPEGFEAPVISFVRRCHGSYNNGDFGDSSPRMPNPGYYSSDISSVSDSCVDSLDSFLDRPFDATEAMNFNAENHDAYEENLDYNEPIIIVESSSEDEQFEEIEIEVEVDEYGNEVVYEEVIIEEDSDDADSDPFFDDPMRDIDEPIIEVEEHSEDADDSDSDGIHGPPEVIPRSPPRSPPTREKPKSELSSPSAKSPKMPTRRQSESSNTDCDTVDSDDMTRYDKALRKLAKVGAAVDGHLVYSPRKGKKSSSRYALEQESPKSTTSKKKRDKDKLKKKKGTSVASEVDESGKDKKKKTKKTKKIVSEDDGAEKKKAKKKKTTKKKVPADGEDADKKKKKAKKEKKKKTKSKDEVEIKTIEMKPTVVGMDNILLRLGDAQRQAKKLINAVNDQKLTAASTHGFGHDGPPRRVVRRASLSGARNVAMEYANQPTTFIG